MSAAARARSRGCLLGVAVGDALGAPFEGHPRPPPEEVDAWAQGDAPLRWTDDTAMTIGVAESLVACGGFDGAHMAEVFAGAYDAEPWRGYGAGPPQVFAALRRGVAWGEAAATLFGGQGSHGNGGAMRAAPAGLVARDVDEAAGIAREQAGITHAHELGRQGAALQAAAVAWAVRAPEETAPRDVLETARRVVSAPAFARAVEALEALPAESSRAEVVAALGSGVTAVEAVPAALHAFLAHPHALSDAVRAAIELGGDTDTIAAMTGAVSGAFLGEEAIPAAWRDRLEAADRLVALADELCSLRDARAGAPADP